MADIVGRQPNPYIYEIENRRKSRPRLAHDLGAGAKCKKCGDKCPGFELHFWRKLCMNCRCGKEEHDVKDDDEDIGKIVIGKLFDRPIRAPKDEIAFSFGNALEICNHETGLSDKLQFDWLPPGVTKSLAARYMEQLPPEKRPIAGSEAAKERKRQLEQQLPLYDMDETQRCENLHPEELQHFQAYIELIRTQIVGQGLIQEISHPKPSLSQPIHHQLHQEDMNYPHGSLQNQTHHQQLHDSEGNYPQGDFHYKPHLRYALGNENQQLQPEFENGNVPINKVWVASQQDVNKNPIIDTRNQPMGQQNFKAIPQLGHLHVGKPANLDDFPPPPAYLMDEAFNNNINPNSSFSFPHGSASQPPKNSMHRFLGEMIGQPFEEHTNSSIASHGPGKSYEQAGAPHPNVNTPQYHKDEPLYSVPHGLGTEPHSLNEIIKGVKKVCVSENKGNERVPGGLYDTPGNPGLENASHNYDKTKDITLPVSGQYGGPLTTLIGKDGAIKELNATQAPYGAQLETLAGGLSYATQSDVHVLFPGESKIMPKAQAAFSCQLCKGEMFSGNVAIFTERAGNDKCWHPSCFMCVTCKELLADLIYFYKGGQIYCGRHFSEAADIPRCKACDELIFEKSWTRADKFDWHLHHFCCSLCDTPLAGSRYVPDSTNGTPYCIGCYMTRMAKTCETCIEKIAPEEPRCCQRGYFYHANEKCFICFCCHTALIEKKFKMIKNWTFCSQECINKSAKEIKYKLNPKVKDC